MDDNTDRSLEKHTKIQYVVKKRLQSCFAPIGGCPRLEGPVLSSTSVFLSTKVSLGTTGFRFGRVVCTLSPAKAESKTAINSKGRTKQQSRIAHRISSLVVYLRIYDTDDVAELAGLLVVQAVVQGTTRLWRRFHFCLLFSSLWLAIAGSFS